MSVQQLSLSLSLSVMLFSFFFLLHVLFCEWGDRVSGTGDAAASSIVRKEVLCFVADDEGLGF